MFQKVLDILVLNKGLGSIWNKMHSGIQDGGFCNFVCKVMYFSLMN